MINFIIPNAYKSDFSMCSKSKNLAYYNINKLKLGL